METMGATLELLKMQYQALRMRKAFVAMASPAKRIRLLAAKSEAHLGIPHPECYASARDYA